MYYNKIKLQRKAREMGKRFTEISSTLSKFIEKQKMFFVGTAGAEGRVNISPKGMDSLRVLDNNRVMWLNVTGSGNETSPHVQENGRVTLMFISFEKTPMILRLYGIATVIHRQDEQWDELSTHLPKLPGARQIFDCHIDLVQTSCGYAVPLYDFAEERSTLRDWAEKKGDSGIERYWEEKNTLSIDGNPTNIL